MNYKTKNVITGITLGIIMTFVTSILTITVIGVVDGLSIQDIWDAILYISKAVTTSCLIAIPITILSVYLTDIFE